jgi:hypothetical protein
MTYERMFGLATKHSRITDSSIIRSYHFIHGNGNLNLCAKIIGSIRLF